MSTTVPTSDRGASHAPAVGRQPLAVRLLLVAGLFQRLEFFTAMGWIALLAGRWDGVALALVT